MIPLGKILLIEDQDVWQLAFKDILRDYSVRVADSRRNAFYALADTFDLVILDLRLEEWDDGNFDGWELMSLLATCRQERRTQVVICTAYGREEHVRLGFKEYKIFDYIDKKRLDPDEFRRIVSDAIQQAHVERGELLD